MSITSEEELEGMKRASAVAVAALSAMRAALEAGVTPAELDALCGRVFAEHGAVSAPRHFYDAPVNAFVSLNRDVVHGLPSQEPLKPGDVVKLDVTPLVDGFVADAAVTVLVPPATREAQRLVACAEAAFWAAMRDARAGRPPAQSHRSQRRARGAPLGFAVIRELAGHGVGRAIHEAPEVPNYAVAGERRLLEEGLVLAVEPMVAAGRGRVETRPDGWTIGTRDGSLGAHYEHIVVITRSRPLVLTA